MLFRVRHVQLFQVFWWGGTKELENALFVRSPFAVVGSIGVIGQSFNIHKTLEGWGIRSLVFRGGKDKAPVGLVGEITEEGMEKVQQMVDDTHKAFKRHVAEARPVIAEQIDEYATGQVWLGYDAEKAGLVDRLGTTDEYLDERILQGAKVLRLARLAAPIAMACFLAR